MSGQLKPNRALSTYDSEDTVYDDMFVFFLGCWSIGNEGFHLNGATATRRGNATLDLPDGMMD